MLSVRDICLSRGGAQLLRGVSLQLRAGEVLALLGPNGAGKTSLLQTVTGLLLPDSGEIEFNGRPLLAWQARQRAQMLAVLPQNPVLDFAFTVEEVLLLGRIPHASGRQRDREIITAAMAQTDIGHLRQRDFRLLSGGEKQRVQLARVLTQIWQPVASGERLLVLDEPAASLDLAHQQLLTQTLRFLADQGVAVLLVLHDINLASICAHRLLLLKAGAIAASGPPAEVIQEEIMRTVFAVDVNIIRQPGCPHPLVLPR